MNVNITEVAKTDSRGYIVFDGNGRYVSLWCVGFRGNLVSRHRTFEAAEKVARRLSIRHGAKIRNCGYGAMGIIVVD
jgi:hypothetical protein